MSNVISKPEKCKGSMCLIKIFQNKYRIWMQLYMNYFKT